MSQILDEILEANERYTRSFGDKSKLPMPPGRRFAILTCIDARLDPAKFAGLNEGDAHVFRNAGGRATDDAIRSLVVSHKMLGTHEWFVIHHTDCGMEYFDDETIAHLLATSLSTAEYDGTSWSNPRNGVGSPEGQFIKWLTISDPEAAVIEDVRRIRAHPLVAPEVVIYGFLFDVKSGRLVEVAEATAIGKRRKAVSNRGG